MSGSSQAWSVRWRCQLFGQCEGQGRADRAKSTDVMIAGFRQCRYLMGEEKMFMKYEAMLGKKFSLC